MACCIRWSVAITIMIHVSPCLDISKKLTIDMRSKTFEKRTNEAIPIFRASSVHITTV